MIPAASSESSFSLSLTHIIQAGARKAGRERVRTVYNIAGLDLVRDFGPNCRVNLLVLFVTLGLELDDLAD